MFGTRPLARLSVAVALGVALAGVPQAAFAASPGDSGPGAAGAAFSAWLAGAWAETLGSLGLSAQQSGGAERGSTRLAAPGVGVARTSRGAAPGGGAHATAKDGGGWEPWGVPAQSDACSEAACTDDGGGFEPNG
jgi:hypothetical protein